MMYKLSLLMIKGVGLLWLAAVLSGCTTVYSTVSRQEITEGPKIKGTEQFELDIKQFVRTPDGTEEQVRLEPEKILMHYQVEQWERTWDIVDRKRQLNVIGIHEKYDFIGDLADPIMTCIGVPIGLIIGLISADVEVLKGTVNLTVAALPFVSLDYQGSDRETVTLNEQNRKIEPVSKTDVSGSNAIKGSQLYWEATDTQGKRRGKGKVEWPDPIRLPWCDWVLDTPEEEAITLAVTSEDVELDGVTDVSLKVDLKDTLVRRWPNADSRPTPKFEIGAVTFHSQDGEKLEALHTGKPATMRVQLQNGWMAPAAYLVAPEISFKSELRFPLDQKPPLRVLDSRSSAEMEYDVNIPLLGPAGKVTLQVSARDLFGYNCDPTVVTIDCNKTEIPDLQVFNATVRPAKGRSSSDYELCLVIRNRGKGDAPRVKVTLSQIPEFLNLGTLSAGIQALPGYSRDEVVFSLKNMLPANVAEVPLTVSLSSGLIMDPVNEEVKAAVIAQQ